MNQKDRSKIFSHIQKEADSLKIESSQLSTYSPHVKKKVHARSFNLVLCVRLVQLVLIRS